MQNAKMSRIINGIKEQLGNEYEVRFVDVPKNNEVLTGISIRKEDDNVAATIYYKESETTAEIINRAVMTYTANGKPDFDTHEVLHNITNWDWAKSRVLPVLFNKDRSVYGNDLVTTDFVSDIGVLFKVTLTTDNKGTASVKVTDGILAKWGVSVDELLTAAKANLNEVVSIRDMQEVLFSLMGANNELARQVTPGAMSVASTTNMVNGASVAMLIPDLVRSGELAKKDYIIIPSSVHEILLLDVEQMEVDAVNNMIADVNTNCVSTQDFLSDYALKYDAKSGEVVRA